MEKLPSSPHNVGFEILSRPLYRMFRFMPNMVLVSSRLSTTSVSRLTGGFSYASFARLLLRMLQPVRGPGLLPLSIGLEMSREGCLPEEELARAMARALRRKTPKADLWKSENSDSECWLVLVDRIGTYLFRDTRQAVIGRWRAALDISSVWDRLLLFVMGDPERPAAELLARRGPYADLSC